VIDFSLGPEIEKQRTRYRAFVREHVLGYDTTPDSFDEHDNIREELLGELRAKAKEHGVWAPQMPVARGYSKDTPIEWIYRYARQARLVDGATEVHQQVLARHFMESRGDFWRWA